MALKRVYRVKRSPYLYNAKNFPPYLMWDITNIPPCKHNVLIVSHKIAGSNRRTPQRGQTNPHIEVEDRL